MYCLIIKRNCNIVRKKSKYSTSLRWILVILLWAIIPLDLCAKKYHIQQNIINSTKRQEKVYSICQDKTGFIWYVSDDGLVYYDGVMPKTISKTASLNIIKIVDGFNNDIILLTNNELYQFNPRKNELKPLLLNHQNSTFTLYDIIKIEGSIYIASNEGLFFCNTAYQWQQKHKEYDIRTITEGEEKTLYFASNNNQIFHTETKNPKTAKLISSINGEITALKYRNNSRVWVGTKRSGIYKIDITTGEQEHFSLSEFSPEPITIKCFSEDGTRRLWAGTSKIGLLRIRDRKSKVHITSYRLDKKDLHQTDYNNINTLFRGKSGLLWIGSNGNGLVNIHFYDHAFRTVMSISNREEVRCILEDKKGYTWVGTLNNGLQRSSFREIIKARKDNKEILLKQYTFNNSIISSNNITAIEEGTNGKIWFSTWGGRLYQLNPSNEKIQTYNFEEFERNTPIGNNILALYQDKKRHLWISTSDGVYLLSKNTKKLERINIQSINNSQSKEKFFEIVEVKDLIILISSKGLYISINKSPFSFDYIPLKENATNKILSAKLDYPNIWLGTQKGLIRFNIIKQEFYRIYDKTNLSNIAIKSIEVDQKQNIWLVTKHDILIYNPITNRFNNLDISFPKGTVFHGPTFYRPQDRSPKMYIETNNGIIVFRPDFIRLNKDKVSAVITHLYSKGESSSSNTMIDKDVSFMDTLRLPATNNSFNLSVSTLGFKNKRYNRIGYMLKGKDKKMHYLMGNHHILKFHDLPSGKYTLLLSASNCNNVWSKKLSKYTIIIDPPFYKSTLACFIYLLVILFIIITGGRIIRKRLMIEYGVKEQAMMMAFAPNTPINNNESAYPISNYSSSTKNSVSSSDNRYRCSQKLQISEINLNNKLKHWCDQSSRYNQIHQCSIQFKSDANIVAFIDWERVKTILLDLLFFSLKHDKNDRVDIELRTTEEKIIITITNNQHTSKGVIPMMYRVLTKNYINNKQNNLLKTHLLAESHKGHIEVNQDQDKQNSFTLILPANKENYTLDERINMAAENDISKQQQRTTDGVLLDSREEDNNITSPEDHFVSEVIEIIKKNVQDPNFSVSNLADELLVSRSYLHGKLKEISGNSPGELIRSIRLKNAAHMLKTSKHNIQEVAFLNGFNDPKYFSRSFKSAYGISPKQYKQKYR